MKDQNHKAKLKNSGNDTYVRCYRLAVRTLGMVKMAHFEPGSGVVIRQLVRSITSIGANILEARSASSKRDFID